MECVVLFIPKINPTKIVNSIGGYENEKLDTVELIDSFPKYH